MKLGKGYKIAFSNDEKTAISISRDVFKWDLESKKKVMSRNLLSNPSEVLIDISDTLFYIKNNSGIIKKVNMDDYSVLFEFKMIPIEGSNLIQNKKDESIINADWNGNVYSLSKNNCEILNPNNFPNAMITHLQDLNDGIHFAFIVQPKWNDEIKKREKPYIVISNWMMDDMKKILFEYSEIYYFSIDLKQKKMLLHIKKNDRKFYIEMINLETAEVVFSQMLEGCGSGNACEMNPVYKNFSFIDNEKVEIRNTENNELIKKIQIKYPCSLSLSNNYSYLGIGSWENSLIINSKSLEEL